MTRFSFGKRLELFLKVNNLYVAVFTCTFYRFSQCHNRSVNYFLHKNYMFFRLKLWRGWSDTHFILEWELDTHFIFGGS